MKLAWLAEVVVLANLVDGIYSIAAINVMISTSQNMVAPLASS